MFITILNHTKERFGYFFNHSATVEVEDWDGNKEELVNKVSIKVHYHPSGYGIYGTPTVIKTDFENEYIVHWKTGASCD